MNLSCVFLKKLTIYAKKWRKKEKESYKIQGNSRVTEFPNTLLSVVEGAWSSK